MPWLSVVVPVRNEAAGIVQVLEPLQGLRGEIEIIVADGGSEDGTVGLAGPLADQVIGSAPGRALQMNAGAALASGEVLLFLHADTRLPEGFLGMIRAVMPESLPVTSVPSSVIPNYSTAIPISSPVIPISSPVIPANAGIHTDPQTTPSHKQESSAQPDPSMDPRVREDDVKGGPDSRAHTNCETAQWGRFDVCLSPSSPALNVVAWMMNQRSRLTGICTGDQAIFVRRDLLNQVGGYADIPLMEDIDLSKRLKRFSPPACIRTPLSTSSRRWQQNGVIRTILLMWSLRLQYWAGVSPVRLAEKYYPARQLEK
ncbi:glycosyltransferase family 2 protein [uncultured Halopseudomonas sp.]|uniref:TIGR04283 family arsenosugar biosynthesis glycosyltransferase n=1 Tax=uncultured Halopseudomonas sp. TaxID=2901193 RepID=UPI0030ECFF03|tara:strand:- start:2144 stop:3085 length:942 start_codon:yes stop_codon:yes gene_type:complete